jgi:hypothetical protein
MPKGELKLKQASAVLGVPPKDLQNFVQSGILRPRRADGLCYFDRKALVAAKVAAYLKDSLGTSTRYLTRFTRAVSKVPGFATGKAEIVRVQSRARDNEPVSIMIPLRRLVAELDGRLPFAEHAKDLPRGRKRAGWKEELRAALQQGTTDLDGASQRDLTRRAKSYRRKRKKPELTVVADAVETAGRV